MWPQETVIVISVLKIWLGVLRFMPPLYEQLSSVRLTAMLWCNLLFDLRLSYLFILDLRDICCWRTIGRGLDMRDVSTPPYRTALSYYLDVMQMKDSWADVIVGWVIPTLPVLCVDVCVIDTAIVAPASVAIQVTRLSSLGAASRGALCGCHPVAVGVAVVSSNQHAREHRRLSLQFRDRE